MCYVHNQWYDISCATLYLNTLDYSVHTEHPTPFNGTALQRNTVIHKETV